MRKLNFKTQKGMALLEVVLALGLMMIILTAIVNVVLTALNNAQFSKNQNIASQYAEEGMEMIREVKEDSFATLYGYGVSPTIYCLNSDLPLVAGTGFGCPTNNDQNIDSFFVRKVKFEKLSSGDCVDPAVLATVSVAWSSGKCSQVEGQDPFCHSAKSVSCFYEL